MYKAIVKRRIRNLFAEANKGNWQAIVDSLNPIFTYRFIGDTPLLAKAGIAEATAAPINDD
jgi:hypothetical protein